MWDEKESVVGLLIPMCTGSALQSVSNQWMNKKKRTVLSLRKGICIFWTKIKAESGEVFSFLCCSFCPAIHLS